MPIPTPADFRDRTKKHTQVREMLAQMAENVESKESVQQKVDAILELAKLFATEKLGTADAHLLNSIQEILNTIIQFRNDYDAEIPVLSSLVSSNSQSVNTDLTKLLLSIQQIAQIIAENRDELDILINNNTSATVANGSAISILQITNATAVNENELLNTRVTRLLLSIQQIIQIISENRDELDVLISNNALVIATNSSAISGLQTANSNVMNENELSNSRIARLLVGIQQITQVIAENRDEIDSITSSISKTTSVNENSTSHLFNAIQGVVAALNDFLTDADRYFDESEKLKRNFIDQQLYMELMKLQNFDPDNTGSNKYIESQGVVFLPIPSNVIRIDIEAEGTLPTAKGTVLRTTTSINVDGQIVKNHSTLEVQGSSSAGFPKKNWTIALFSDADRTNSILIKLGHMMPHDELVWKANLVDNTHSRNLAVNRLWDQMVLARSGFPKREVDFVNMPGGVGLSYAPTGALGHVDGFQAVVYINGAFYGIGSLNIGKKRGNYNLKSNDQKHIQLEPQGGVNYTAMPTSPTNADSALEIRRPSTWGLEAQGYYERLISWMAKSRQDMEADGIDNFFNRKNLMDYIILVQVCDLWDHMGKNAELTTWNGSQWYFLPYDCDTVFGLYWTGTIINPNTGTPWRPPEGLLINQNGTAGPVGFFSKCRRIYGTDIDARYAFLRNQRIIDVDNITNICADLLRKFPTELLTAEDQKWNTGGASTYSSLIQSSSIAQIHDWLSIRIPLVDAYFNYTA